MSKLYIIAGNYRQAFDWAHRHELRPQDWIYVIDEMTLRGTHYPDYIEVGTPWFRKDYHKLMDTVIMVQARIRRDLLKPKNLGP